MRTPNANAHKADLWLLVKVPLSVKDADHKLVLMLHFKHCCVNESLVMRA